MERTGGRPIPQQGKFLTAGAGKGPRKAGARGRAKIGGHRIGPAKKGSGGGHKLSRRNSSDRKSLDASAAATAEANADRDEHEQDRKSATVDVVIEKMKADHSLSVASTAHMAAADAAEEARTDELGGTAETASDNVTGEAAAVESREPDPADEGGVPVPPDDGRAEAVEDPRTQPANAPPVQPDPQLRTSQVAARSISAEGTSDMKEGKLSRLRTYIRTKVFRRTPPATSATAETSRAFGRATGTSVSARLETLGDDVNSSLKEMITASRRIRDSGEKREAQEQLVQTLEALSASDTGRESITTLDLRGAFTELEASDCARAYDAVGTFSKLESLTLTSNAIGKLPDAFKGLTSLRTLEASNAGLTDLSAIADLTNLVTVNLSNNEKLDHLPEGRWTESVQELQLKNCALTSLPSGLTSLRIANVESNQLSSLPADLQVTRILNIAGNRLTSLSEETIDSLSKGGLISLNMNLNPLETLPENFGTMSTLEEFNCTDTALRELPKDLSGLTALKSLNLTAGNLEALPESISSLLQLKRLDLAGNLITELPSSFAGLTNLEVLRLAGNRLTTIDTRLTALENLTTLDVAANEVDTFKMPEGAFSKLEELNVGSNHLESLPEGIGSCENLTDINANNNLLTDLPASLGSMKLEKLALDKNLLERWDVEGDNFYGSIKELSVEHNLLPDLGDSKAWASASKLTKLRASYNALTELPEDIPSEQLVTVTLSHNELASLPPWCVGVHGYLVARSNRITELPPMPEGRHGPAVVNLSANRLSGEVDFSTWSGTTRLQVGFNPELVVTGIPVGAKHLSFAGVKQVTAREALDRWATKALETNHDPDYRSEGDRAPYSLHCDAPSAQWLPGAGKTAGPTHVMYAETCADFGVGAGHIKQGRAIVGSHTTNGGNSYQEDRVIQDAFKFKPPEGWSPAKTERAIQLAFKKTVDAVAGEEWADHTGAQFTGAVRLNGKVHRFNVGDSRGLRLSGAAVESAIAGDGAIDDLAKAAGTVSGTEDHNLSDPSERARAREEGARFTQDGSSLRADGVAAPRGIGDNAKRGISHDAVLEGAVDLDTSLPYLSFEGCDGVFDTLENDQVAEIILRHIRDGGSTPKKRKAHMQKSLDAAMAEINSRVLAMDLDSGKTDNTTMMYHYADPSALSSSRDKNKVILTGIADGHRGAQASQFIEENFSRFLQEAFSEVATGTHTGVATSEREDATSDANTADVEAAAAPAAPTAPSTGQVLAVLGSENTTAEELLSEQSFEAYKAAIDLIASGDSSASLKKSLATAEAIPPGEKLNWLSLVLQQVPRQIANPKIGSAPVLAQLRAVSERAASLFIDEHKAAQTQPAVKKALYELDALGDELDAVQMASLADLSKADTPSDDLVSPQALLALQAVVDKYVTDPEKRETKTARLAKLRDLKDPPATKQLVLAMFLTDLEPSLAPRVDDTLRRQLRTVKLKALAAKHTDMVGDSDPKSLVSTASMHAYKQTIKACQPDGAAKKGNLSELERIKGVTPLQAQLQALTALLAKVQSQMPRHPDLAAISKTTANLAGRTQEAFSANLDEELDDLKRWLDEHDPRK